MSESTPKTVVVGPLRISEDLARRIRERAAREDRSVSSILRLAAEAYLRPAPADVAKRAGR